MLKDITVIKVGGNEVDDAAWIRSLARAVDRLASPVVVVHGGGKEVTDLQRSLGAEPEWRDGLRVTTPDALRAVSMVLSGLVNKRIVAALLDAGRDAVGLSGEDSGLLLAEPAAGGALGRTGTVVRVDRRVLEHLLRGGFIPVVSPVSRGTDGAPLNVNADDAAAALAVGLGATRLLMISNVRGLLDRGVVIPEVEDVAVEGLITSGVAGGGMGPKLRAASLAARSGVTEVRIGDLCLLAEHECGTRVVHRTPMAASA